MDDPVTFWLDFWNVLTLRSGYNATLVILGTASLGIASGIVGTFAVLRRRALMADALGHATLPGVVGGFLLSLIFGATGPEILPLLIGGGCSGLLGIWLVQFLVRHPRIREDAAIGLVPQHFFWPRHCSLERGPNFCFHPNSGPRFLHLRAGFDHDQSLMS